MKRRQALAIGIGASAMLAAATRAQVVAHNLPPGKFGSPPYDAALAAKCTSVRPTNSRNIPPKQCSSMSPSKCNIGSLTASPKRIQERSPLTRHWCVFAVPLLHRCPWKYLGLSMLRSDYG